MNKLKQGWLNLVGITILTALIVSYAVTAYIYKFIAIGNIELMDALLQPKNIYEAISTDENLKLIVPFIPFLAVGIGFYLLRKSIFDLKYDDASDFGVKGSAKWGNPLALMNNKTLWKTTKYGNLKKSLALPEGIILGVAENQKNLLIMHDKTDLATRNVFVNGSSGAGKGQAYVLNNIINNRTESMIIVDPKGENYALTSQLKRDQGYKVYMVDFRNFEYAKYNPLDYVKNDEDAQKVSKIISINSVGDGKEDFFTERAQKLLAGLISYVKTEYPDDQANMATLIDVYTEHVADGNKCERWLSRMSDEQPAKRLLVSVLADLTSENTRSSVTSSFQSAISIFQLNRVRNMTLTSDFTFDTFPEEKSVVYVKISAPSNPFKPLTSVFFTQMIERFFEIGDHDPLGRLKTPVHFLLDEFANIGKIDIYEKTLALCRGYRIYMHTIVQDVSQLESKALYGKEVTKSILSNHSAKLILKVGEKDSAKYWAEWFGKTTISYKKESASFSKQGKTTNTSKQFEQKELVSPNDLLEMPDETAYLLLSGHDPIRINKAWQYKLYPGLLADENREPNYLTIRSTLGFTEKPINDLYKTGDDDAINLFSGYRNRNEKSVESLLENIEPEEIDNEIEINETDDLINNVANQIKVMEELENLTPITEVKFIENEASTESSSVIEDEKEFPEENVTTGETEVNNDVSEEEDIDDLLSFDVKEELDSNDKKIDTGNTDDLLKSLEHM